LLISHSQFCASIAFLSLLSCYLGVCAAVKEAALFLVSTLYPTALNLDSFHCYFKLSLLAQSNSAILLAVAYFTKWWFFVYIIFKIYHITW